MRARTDLTLWFRRDAATHYSRACPPHLYADLRDLIRRAEGSLSAHEVRLLHWVLEASSAPRSRG